MVRSMTPATERAKAGGRGKGGGGGGEEGEGANGSSIRVAQHQQQEGHRKMRMLNAAPPYFYFAHGGWNKCNHYNTTKSKMTASWFKH